MPFVNCKQCGKLNSVKLAKCPKCGFPLIEEKREPAAPITPASAKAAHATPPPFGGQRPASAFGPHPAPPPLPAQSPFGSQSEPHGGIPRRRNPYYTGN